MSALDCAKYAAGLCRSCTNILQPYAAQLEQKQGYCEQLLAPFFSDPEHPCWEPACESAVSGFRNRAKFVVGGKGGSLTLGLLNAEGNSVDLTDCPIQDPRVNAAGVKLRSFLNQTGLSPYRVAQRRGELKFVHVTVAPTGELLVRFVVRSMRAAKTIERNAAKLRAEMPELNTVTINLLPEHIARLEGETEYVLWGSQLPMRLPEVTLSLLPQSFFQTNTAVAAELYQQATVWAERVRPTKVWDLYCGVGGFALHLAGPGREVLGVELSELAVRAARKSAKLQGRSARFIAQDATEFATAADPGTIPDLLVVNPPRRGIGSELCGWIADAGIEWVLYSSCNPDTLAADLQQMRHYEIISARLFDMFPHTAHMEVAVLLRKPPQSGSVR